MRRRLVSARVIALLVLLRMSADMRFAGERLPELNRRLIWLIGVYGGLTSVELVALTGQEKAQISRAVQALSIEGLIDRPSLRAPILLSPAGQAVHDALMPIELGRNKQIVRGIPPRDLARFLATSRCLIDRAALLFSQERAIGWRPEQEGRDADPIDLPPLPEPLPHPDRPDMMVAPTLAALSAYLGRSATISFRRETGLSKFTWQMLSQIGEHQPITLAQLIALSYRDKSQVGRAVKWLEAEGLATRRKQNGQRDIALACTAAGNTTYATMCEIARRRDDFLCADFGSTERHLYVATLDALTANAKALLARERTSPRPIAHGSIRTTSRDRRSGC